MRNLKMSKLSLSPSPCRVWQWFKRVRESQRQTGWERKNIHTFPTLQSASPKTHLTQKALYSEICQCLDAAHTVRLTKLGLIHWAELELDWGLTGVLGAVKPNNEILPTCQRCLLLQPLSRHSVTLSMCDSNFRVCVDTILKSVVLVAKHQLFTELQTGIQASQKHLEGKCWSFGEIAVPKNLESRLLKELYLHFWYEGHCETVVRKIMLPSKIRAQPYGFKKIYIFLSVGSFGTITQLCTANIFMALQKQNCINVWQKEILSIKH